MKAPSIIIRSLSMVLRSVSIAAALLPTGSPLGDSEAVYVKLSWRV